MNYNFTYRGPEIQAREIGLRFGVPPWMDTLSWKRRGEWTTYPPDHIGRNQGRAKLHSGISRAVPPVNAYAEDDSPMGTNDFRSTKRNIEQASITTSVGSGLYIESNGKQTFARLGGIGPNCDIFERLVWRHRIKGGRMDSELRYRSPRQAR